MMALTAANAISPATMSFGLCNSMRSNRPRSAGSSMMATARPRFGLVSFELALGPLLHLGHLDDRRAARGRRQRRDITGLMRRRREVQRQRDADGGALVDPALDPHLAAMHGHEILHDRQAEA